MAHFSTFPAAGGGTLTHHLYVSLVSSQIETVSKTCHFKLLLQQYCLALLNSPQEEAYEHLFTGLLSYLGLGRSLESPISLLSSGLVHKDLYLHSFENIFGSTYIFRKVMMSSMS